MTYNGTQARHNNVLTNLSSVLFSRLNQIFVGGRISTATNNLEKKIAFGNPFCQKNLLFIAYENVIFLLFVTILLNIYYKIVIY